MTVSLESVRRTGQYSDNGIRYFYREYCYGKYTSRMVQIILPRQISTQANIDADNKVDILYDEESGTLIIRPSTSPFAVRVRAIKRRIKGIAVPPSEVTINFPWYPQLGLPKEKRQGKGYKIQAGLHVQL